MTGSNENGYAVTFPPDRWRQRIDDHASALGLLAELETSGAKIETAASRAHTQKETSKDACPSGLTYNLISKESGISVRTISHYVSKTEGIAKPKQGEHGFEFTIEGVRKVANTHIANNPNVKDIWTKTIDRLKNIQVESASKAQ